MHITDCIFCKIVEGRIPSSKVYEDDECLVFHDIMPKAPVHVMLIPKLHIPSMAQLTEQHSAMIGRMLIIVPKIAKLLEVKDFPEGGFRFIANTGDDARQEVHHLHFHLLAGTKLSSSL